MGLHPSRFLSRCCRDLRIKWTSMVPMESQYEVVRIIGSGGFSLVRLACHRLTGTHVAIKTVPRRGPESEMIAREIDIMKKLHHPNVIKLYQISRSWRYVHIIMQFAEGGDLLTCLCRVGVLKEEEASQIFGQILCGVHYLHKSGVVHGDLKPKNILIDARGTIKISDFGLSSYFTEGENIENDRGTPHYFSPERLLSSSYDGPKADIWCLGVTLYEMVIGYKPFYSHSIEGLFTQIAAGNIWTPSEISSDVRDLIHLLLKKNPSERPSLENIMVHPWVAQSKEFTVPQPDNTGLNPSVVHQMKEMGFRLQDLYFSVQKQMYNNLTCLYLLLQEKEDNKKPAQLERPESPTMAGPSTLAVPKPGTIGDPPVDPFLVPSFSQDCSDKKEGQKGESSRTIPGHPQHCQDKNIVTTSTPPPPVEAALSPS